MSFARLPGWVKNETVDNLENIQNPNSNPRLRKTRSSRGSKVEVKDRKKDNAEKEGATNNHDFQKGEEEANHSGPRIGRAVLGSPANVFRRWPAIERSPARSGRLHLFKRPERRYFQPVQTKLAIRGILLAKLPFLIYKHSKPVFFVKKEGGLRRSLLDFAGNA